MDQYRESVLAAGKLLQNLTIDTAPVLLKKIIKYSETKFGGTYKFSTIPMKEGSPMPEAWIQFKKQDIFVIVNPKWAEVRAEAGLNLEDPDQANPKSTQFLRNNYLLEFSYRSAIMREIKKKVTEYN